LERIRLSLIIAKNNDWFERQLERTFPEFDEWIRRSREAEKKEKRKVA
jgi:hypothetical protein